MRVLRSLIKKETFQIIRDPSTILISVVLPMILMFLYGFGVSLDLDHLRLGIVMEDTAPDAQRLVKSFTDSPYFDVKIVRDRRELEVDLMKGHIRGFIVIPSYFSSFRHRPSTVAPLQVIADGSEPNTANFLQNYVRGAYLKWLGQEGEVASLTDVQARYWYNEQLESRFFLLSGSLAIIMTLIGTLLTALVVSREWERGTMEALMSTPVSIRQLIAGKVIPYFVLGMLSMVICVVISTLGYGLPFRGSWGALTITSASFLFCALAIGLFISTVAKNQIIASQMALVVGFLPAYILSGFLFEISSMPLPIQWLTYVIPAKYFVQCLQTLFLVGNIWSILFYNMVFMMAIGFFFFFLTARKTVKRLD